MCDCLVQIATIITGFSSLVIAGCTAFLLYSLRQVHTAVAAQKLAAINTVFEDSERIKNKFSIVYKLKVDTETQDLNAWLNNEQCREVSRKVSAALNRYGYLCYIDCLDPSVLIDNFADVYIRSFLHLKPYLDHERKELRKEAGEAWFIRKHLLIMVPLCQAYMKKHHPENKLAEVDLLVKPAMLEDDLKRWVNNKLWELDYGDILGFEPQPKNLQARLRRFMKK